MSDENTSATSVDDPAVRNPDLDFFRRVAWAALTTEPPVDPERRIVDPHHHLWQQGGWKYRIADYARDAATGHNITSTVFIECQGSYRQSGPDELRPVGETEFVAAEARQAADRDPHVAALVAHADLALGDGVEAVLAAHETAGDGLFRGIRHMTTWSADPNPHAHTGADADPALLSRYDFRRALARLGDMGYSFDAFVFHSQLPELADATRAVEGTTFILDHLGAPMLGTASNHDRVEIRAQWRAGMRDVAKCENVVVKLGALGMDGMFGTGWSSRERPPDSDEVAAWWGDDIRFCIDTFGPGRCMFESNYPIDRESLGYGVIWNAFQKIAGAYTNAEQDQLFAATAERVYRLA
jgi:predicted TIM-barrel fold metal-dependent hydrolase